MFTDIFTSFDPLISHNSLLLSPEKLWTINLLILCPLAPAIWINPSHISWFLFLLLDTIFQQLTRSRAQKFLGWNAIISTLFIFLILFNLISLTPYVFRLTRHLLFTFSFGLTLWLRIILSSIFSLPIKFVAILLPGGAPPWLNPFLVIVETSRFSVRPITLSFRLAANIRAGHIVITLIALFTANALLTSLTSALTILLPSQIAYIMFEIGICFIQAFIFCLLLSLYANDHP